MIKHEITRLNDSMSNASGDKENSHKLLIIGGILVIGLAIIFKK